MSEFTQFNDESQWCSYYGRLGTDPKPTKGWHYLMLDDHIKRKVEKEKDKLREEMREFLKTFEKDIKIQLKNLYSRLTKLEDLTKNMVKENKLKEKQLKKENTLSPVEDEDNEDVIDE